MIVKTSRKYQMIDRLFVPLNKEWYKLFASGKKKWEMRGYSPRFNEKTVKVGRSIELRKGYMKEGAIWGVITEFHITNNVHELPLKVIEELFPTPPSSPLWEYIQWYNAKYNKFIVFKIEVKE